MMLTRDERAAIEVRAKNLGLTLSDYMRRLIDGKPVLVGGGRDDLRKLHSALEQLAKEVRRAKTAVDDIGHNVNQLTKLAHETGRMPDGLRDIEARVARSLEQCTAALADCVVAIKHVQKL